MAPANTYSKVRVPSANGSCKEQMPPAKRARESLLTPDAKRLGVGRALPDAENKIARGNTGSPPDAEQKVATERTPTDAENSSRGKYDISDPMTLKCPICFKSLSLPVYQCVNGHIIC